MNNKARFIGIDLLKIISAYAVVYIHSQGGNYGDTGYWAAKIGIFFNIFAVPFFLAVSFYFLLKKIYSDNKGYSLTARLKFLALPYVVWTLIYLLFRLVKYLTHNEISKMLTLFGDPIAILFLGGAAVQLYFIPLLISGIICFNIVNRIINKSLFYDLKIIVLLAILSIGIYELILDTGNAFHLGKNLAFINLINSTIPELNSNQIIRLLLVELSWFLRCLPYIFIAMILNHPVLNRIILKLSNKYIVIFFCLAFFIHVYSVFCNLIFPPFINEIIITYLYVVFSILLSNKMSDNYWLKNMSVCSFGIYLIHHLLVEFIRPVIYKFYPGSITLITVSTCATISFLLSWLFVFYLRKYTKARVLLFGN
ncbi:acyltransferase [Calothrix sp. FACHB-156]|nr:acyltransferase [Calothrix sp. FACHB-156]